MVKYLELKREDRKYTIDEFSEEYLDEYLRMFLKDAKYSNQDEPWKFDFKKSYLSEDCSKKFYNPIELILKYKSGVLDNKNLNYNITNSYGVNADCDKEAFLLYKVLGWQKRQIEILRGDTMNSFFSLFNYVLSNYIKESREIFYTLFPKKNRRQISKNDIKSLLEADVFDQLLSEIPCREEFERYAANVHTIGNFITLPHWMNTGRGLGLNDYWDLTMQSLYTFYSETGFNESDYWKNYIDKYALHVFVDEDYKPCEFWKNHFENLGHPSINKNSKNKESITISELEYYLNNVNSMIEQRGKILFARIESKQPSNINDKNIKFGSNIIKETKESFKDLK